jgi:hypothetical protein
LKPAPWRKPKFTSISTPTEQVWFAGSHSDVGGGYLDEEVRQKSHPFALDDITLDWMLRRLLHHYPDFPVKSGTMQAWPQITPEWSDAPQHEARTGFYKARPFAFRSIGNCAVPIKRAAFESNVCRDRHANPIGEMVHVSVIERLGRRVEVDGSKNVYAPKNLVAALDAITATYGGTVGNGSEVRVANWSGETLSADLANQIVHAAKRRLLRL